MKTIDLLTSENTEQLHSSSAFDFYHFKGKFPEKKSFKIDSEKMGIFICLRGTVFCKTEALSFQLSEHLISFAFKSQCSKIVPKDTEVQLLFLLFSKSQVQALIEESGHTQFALTDLLSPSQCTISYCNEEILKSISNLFTECHEDMFGRKFMVKLTFKRILIYFIRLFIQQPAHRQTSNLIPSIKSFVNNNFARSLKIQDFERFSGYSKSYLTSLFRKETGMSLIQYLNYIRVQKACEMIREKVDTIENIAHRTGFKNLGYFYKVFRKNTGQLPSVYREGIMTAAN